jgi:PIN domain nuclease of toxin-antitoxin system
MAKMREISIVHCRSIFSSIVFVEQQMLQNNMSLLSVQISHLNLVANLPLHHRDPFDRLIIAQSMVEQIPTVNTSYYFLVVIVFVSLVG